LAIFKQSKDNFNITNHITRLYLKNKYLFFGFFRLSVTLRDLEVVSTRLFTSPPLLSYKERGLGLGEYAVLRAFYKSDLKSYLSQKQEWLQHHYAVAIHLLVSGQVVLNKQIPAAVLH
jgi:hypothetical protein